MGSTHHDRLVRIFAMLMPPLVGGCVGADDTIDRDQFTEDLCSPESGLLVLGQVTPAVAVDYIERRTVSQIFPGPDLWGSPVVGETVGDKCRGATDAAACEAAFEALPPESEFRTIDGFDAAEYHHSLAFSRGDEVGALRSDAEVLDFLGAIDSPGDAALIADLRNHNIVCRTGANVAASGDGHVLHTRTGGGCGQGDDIEEHVVLVHPDGTIEVIETEFIEAGEPGCNVGRLPPGLCRASRRVHRRAHPVGAFFSGIATLEAASVPAFAQLGRELRVHRAPTSMLAAARRAQHDEVRHARQVRGLARRYGANPVAPRVAAVAPRGLVEVARDNLAEGCIRETFGALVAHVQARRAHDPRVRRVLGQIALDETRHAAVSWELAQWLDARMSPVERRHVARGSAETVDRMQVELTGAYAESVHTLAGMPRPEQARDLFTQLRRAMPTLPRT